MTEEQKTPESQKNTWDLLDVLTSRVGKITLLIGAIGTLGVTVKQLIPPGPQPRALPDCFQSDMSVEPKTVALSKWKSMMLAWTGRNDCQATLNAYVTFKMANDKVRIKPLAGECVSHEPSCWQQVTINTGKTPQGVIRPDLYFLSKPLGEPVDLNINWVVYNMEDKKQLRAGIVQITLLDDP